MNYSSVMLSIFICTFITNACKYQDIPRSRFDNMANKRKGNYLFELFHKCAYNK